MPRITVIIPTFNRRALVQEAVQSVLEQTYADYELVVVDDGSADGTARALAEELGNRLRVICAAHRGVSAARNAGVAASDSEWIAFLDSDDLWLPDKLAAQVGAFRDRPDLQICQTEELWLRCGVRVNPRHRHRKLDGDIFLPSLALCLVSPSAVMMSRRLFEDLGGFDESLPACEDYDLWLRVSRRTHVGLVPQPLVVRRAGHADQLSRRYWGMDRFRIRAMIKLLSEPLEPEHRRAALEMLARKCAIVAAGAEKRGRVDEANHYRALAGSYD